MSYTYKRTWYIYKHIKEHGTSTSQYIIEVVGSSCPARALFQHFRHTIP